MSNIAKLKKKAAELEQKKQFDKALAVYIQILEDSESLEEADVALYNRVGDLLLRQGNVPDAVSYYEKAVDLYAEGGFFNNAIALCNKILRNSPGRSSIYYKLGRISAKKGFVSDAKQNFLEYADRMQRAGQIDEAFRALKEFADLCPDQDDIRLMLAEQLSRKDRKGEALEQLQTLYDKLESEGRTAEARATLDRMKAIDPSAEPKVGGEKRPQKSSDLVFLDVTYDEPPPRSKAPAPRNPPPDRAPPRAAAPPATGGLPFLDTSPEPPPLEPPRPREQQPPERLELQESGMPDVGSFDATDHGQFGSSLDAGPVAGFEETTFGGRDASADAGSDLLDFEPTSFGNLDFGSGLGSDSSSIFTEERAGPEHDLALPGELPMLDLPGDADGSGDDARLGAGFELILPEDESSIRSHDRYPGDREPPIARETSAEVPMFGAGGAGLGIEQDNIDFFLNLDQGAESLASARADAAEPGPALGDFDLTGDASMEQQQGALPEDDSGLSMLELPPEATLGDAAFSDAPPYEDADSLEGLQRLVQRNQGDPVLRRRYAETLLEQGQRELGLQELELAMIAFERTADLDSAESVADEIIRINPNSVRHHQKRVEYAFRTNDKPRLSEAYLELADSLFRTGQPDKAKAVYQRVLELSPNDIRAQAALSTFVESAPAAPPPRRIEKKEPSGTFRRYAPESKRGEPPAGPRPAAAAPTGGGNDFVNLADWLRDEEAPKSTRMVVQEQAPSGDEQADFADMLRRFKQGVAQNVEDEDHESHYDLGVAYKEMGLLDEAVAEFQKALRGSEHRVRAYEALGQCFLEQMQFHVAATVLERALAEGGHSDDQLVGVLYLFGYACEGLQRWDDALAAYQRVFAVDIQFRDVSERIAALERVLQ